MNQLPKLLLVSAITLTLGTIACSTGSDTGMAETAQTAADTTATPAAEDRSNEFAAKAAFYRAEYIRQYNEKQETTQQFQTKAGRPVIVKVSLHALGDSALVIPGRYVLEDTTKNFITHNYAQDITVTVAGKTVFNRTVTKEDVRHLLTPELQQYGTFADFETPEYDTAADRVLIRSTFAIPITDVSRPVHLAIGVDGKMEVIKE